MAMISLQRVHMLPHKVEEVAASVVEHAVSEKEFMQQIIQLAKYTNWMIYHTHDSRRSEPGFPDLVLVKHTIFYAEIKTARGRLSAAQKVWIERLRAAGAMVYVWRPAQWKEIVRVLTGQCETGEAA